MLHASHFLMSLVIRYTIQQALVRERCFWTTSWKMFKMLSIYVGKWPKIWCKFPAKYIFFKIESQFAIRFEQNIANKWGRRTSETKCRLSSNMAHLNWKAQSTHANIVSVKLHFSPLNRIEFFNCAAEKYSTSLLQKSIEHKNQLTRRNSRGIFVQKNTHTPIKWLHQSEIMYEHKSWARLFVQELQDRTEHVELCVRLYYERKTHFTQ